MTEPNPLYGGGYRHERQPRAFFRGSLNEATHEADCLAAKPSDRPMHKLHDHRPANDPAGLWRGERESASAQPPPQAITSQARRQQPRFAPSPPRQRASTGKAAARASQSEVESMPPPAANHLPPDVFFSGAALLAELGPGTAQPAPAQMKRFGRFMTPYSSDRAQ